MGVGLVAKERETGVERWVQDDGNEQRARWCEYIDTGGLCKQLSISVIRESDAALLSCRDLFLDLDSEAGDNMAGTAPAATAGNKRKRPPTFSHLPMNRGTALPRAYTRWLRLTGDRQRRS